ncbi:MAG: glycosyltransferase family 9 protein [Syntrophobacteraceae bacterium]
MELVTTRLTRTDCVYFGNDKPCVFHKKEKVLCDGCPHYTPKATKILIIKLDAVGDVLRTTGILPALVQAYPGSYITWISKSDGLPLFKNNNYVHQVVEYGPEAQLLLMTEEFDLAINLDAAPSSSRLMSIARSTKKLGFQWNSRGFSEPLHPEADVWFQMGIWDDLKKMNRDTYQDIMMKICGLKGRPGLPVFIIDDDEQIFAADFAGKKGFINNRPIIGLNTGAGRRWRFKKWTLEGYRQLILRLRSSYPDSAVLLYGGPEEVERNRELLKVSKGVIDTGCDNDLRHFGALVGLCDLLVTGDTLAMHIGIALRKKVVVLFGPTSASEIEIYGSGSKITPEMPCTCCYLPDCDVRPTCMDNITVDEVLRDIQDLLG